MSEHPPSAGQSRNLREQLQIMIITYNRSPFLRRTLGQLRDSPFGGCSITVLDNCSTDETVAVCAEYAPIFPSLHVVRHSRNIGACPNYLRAVEMSEGAYTWVLCDDDEFDFSECDDVVAAINEGTADLIEVGSPGDETWGRGEMTTAGEIMSRGGRYFHVFTFIPSVIFRTTLFNSECLSRGYKNSANLYPHFEFVRQTARDNRSVYISRWRIVKRDPHESVPNLLYWLTSWVNSCRSIADAELRKRVIYEVSKNRIEWFSNVVHGVIAEKIQQPDRALNEYAELLIGCRGGQRLFVLGALPFMLLPASLYRWLRRVKRRLGGRSETEQIYKIDEFRT